MMTERPNDLITITEASVLADRGKSTIRLWVRKHLISGYKQNPSNKNSTLLVSKNEIMAHLAVNGKINPPRPKPIDEITVSAQQWQVEKSKLINQIKGLERERELMAQLLEQSQENINIQKRMAEEIIDAKKKVEAELQRQIKTTEMLELNNVRLSRRIEDLMSYLSMPWWRKWSVGVPLLTTKKD